MFGHGLLFVTSGYGSTALYAVRADSRGEIAATDAAWTLRRGTPNDPSPLLVGDELYILSDQGVTNCVDARTGKSHWHVRLPGAYSASPIVAEERIYFTNEDGLTTVMAAGKTLKKLATSQVDGRTLASLAAADRRSFCVATRPCIASKWPVRMPRTRSRSLRDSFQRRNDGARRLVAASSAAFISRR